MDSVLLNPVPHYAALAIGLGLCLYLFCCSKRDLATLERRWQARQQALEQESVQFRAAIEGLRTNLQEVEMNAAVMASTPELTPSKRVQALRMNRRGEPTSTIAAALNVPEREIDLLLKIDRLARQAS